MSEHLCRAVYDLHSRADMRTEYIHGSIDGLFIGLIVGAFVAIIILKILRK